MQYGTCAFNVTADKTYYVFCTGSKLGFADFEFTAGASLGIEKAEVAAAFDEDAPSTTFWARRSTSRTKAL